jgi:23S rRNA (cytosine1962-C5)-methyltransferase
MLAQVQVNRRAADRAASGHPWIYATELVSRPELAPGSVVGVVGPRRERIGTAHYSSSSQIALRLLSRRAETVDTAFFRARLERAAAYRREVVRDTTACRLVHGEGDGLPALILDRYGDYFVLQTLDQGMEAAKPLILEALRNLFAPAGVIERNGGLAADRGSTGGRSPGADRI